MVNLSEEHDNFTEQKYSARTMNRYNIQSRYKQYKISRSKVTKIIFINNSISFEHFLSTTLQLIFGLLFDEKFPESFHLTSNFTPNFNSEKHFPIRQCFSTLRKLTSQCLNESTILQNVLRSFPQLRSLFNDFLSATSDQPDV